MWSFDEPFGYFMGFKGYVVSRPQKFITSVSNHPLPGEYYLLTLEDYSATKKTFVQDARALQYVKVLLWCICLCLGCERDMALRRTSLITARIGQALRHLKQWLALPHRIYSEHVIVWSAQFDNTCLPSGVNQQTCGLCFLVQYDYSAILQHDVQSNIFCL